MVGWEWVSCRNVQMCAPAMRNANHAFKHFFAICPQHCSPFNLARASEQHQQQQQQQWRRRGTHATLMEQATIAGTAGRAVAIGVLVQPFTIRFSKFTPEASVAPSHPHSHAHTYTHARKHTRALYTQARLHATHPHPHPHLHAHIRTPPPSHREYTGACCV
jgi:hypothetical protein